MSEELCVTFLWKIENLLFCTLKEGESLNSPAFYVESLSRSEWYLGLIPNNRKIKVFLHNVYFHDSDLSIDYDFDYVDKDNFVLWEAGGDKDIQIDPDTSYDCRAYPLKDSLLKARDKPSLTDILTIRCKIWPSRKPLKRSVKYVSRTWIGIERRVFHWEVPEFSQLEIGGEKRTRKIITGSNKPTFFLELFLKGVEANQAKVCVDIKQLNDSISRLFYFCEISVLNAKGDTLVSHSDYHTFHGNDSVWNFSWCLTKNKMMENQQEYLDGDVLNLLFAITFNTGEKHSNIESVTTLPSWVPAPKENNAGISLKDVQDPDSDTSLSDVRDPDSDTSLSDVRDPDSDMSMSDVREPDSDVCLHDVQDPDSNDSSEESSAILQESFAYMYKDRSLSDFELRSESVPFPVHKHVLAARSTVFNAIFESMKESEENFIEIPDVNAVTLDMLLKFIYTGDVESLDWSNAIDLYNAAEKYQVHPLKQKCCKFLYGSNS